MKSIYFKNFSATAAMVVMSFLFLGLVLVFLGRSYVINSYRAGMETNAQEVSRSAQALASDGELNDWSLRMTLSTVSQTSGNHIFLSDSTGTVVSCSDMNIACVHLGKQLGEGVLSALRANGQLNQITTLGSFYDKPHYVVAQPIRSAVDDSVIIGYVFVTADTATIIDSWDTFLVVYLAAAAVVMVIALLMAFMTSKRMAKPLDEMARATRHFAHGDFSVRVEEDDRTDEVGTLVSAFNTMADSLEKSEQRRNDFIANVSHELKTPMTTIAGYAEGLLDGTIPKENEDKYLAIIAEETRRLSRLVRSMLDISRLENSTSLTRRREFDLLEVVITTLLSFEDRANAKKLDMDLQLPENHVNVLGDPDAITRVVYNLLDNAIKFARQGSTLTVALWKTDGKAYVSVRDQGETIPESDLPFIFDRFHKSDRSRSLDRDGVGLGLYLVKSILDAHGEDIAVTSRDGQTEFVFTVMLAPPAPKEKAAKEKAAKEKKK